jgi:tetratricopeptide (TPR) repeat protein
MKSDEYWHSGQADRMIPVLQTVTLLDPHFLDAWRIAGWHWAYNLSVETDDPVKKEMCFQKGIEFLKQGIGWNPDRFDLYFELGWTYFDKLGDYISSVEYFEQARLKKNAPRNPDYIQRMIGHAYERIPDIPRALDAYAVVIAEEPGKPLGSVSYNLKSQLSGSNLSPAIRQEFKRVTGKNLTPQAILLPRPKHNLWLINDRGANKYTPIGGYALKDEEGKLNLYPGDTTGIGATVTIEARYVPTWKLYARGDWPGAEAAMKDYLLTDPSDVIGNHLLARIYEKWGETDRSKLKQALDVWQWMSKHNSTDKLAPRRALILKKQLRETQAT